MQKRGVILEEKKSLNNKYQKIDIDETPEEVVEPAKEKPKKEKKAKEPKAPKVKKEKTPKEPKQPKEKKEKAPKEPKPKKEKTPKEPKPPKEKKEKIPKQPKEKKVKESKPIKVKKEKKKKWAVEIVEDISAEITETPVVENIQEEISENGRRSEEFVLPVVKSVKKISVEPENEKKEEVSKKIKEKKQKTSKEPKKDKTPKEPKPLKEKKEKAPKQPKEKKVKEPKQPKEKKPREPLTKKDFVTIGIAVLALVMVVAFVVVKFVPESELETDFTETTTVPQDKLASVQVVRDGIIMNLIQTDIPDVFYGISSDYKIKYYQYKESKMVAVQSTGSVNATVDMGNETIPVTIDYVELGGKIFGVGLFVANSSENVYFYDMLAFQLVNLPEGYEQEGKALLLATTSKSVLTQKVTAWPESFVVDLNTGKTSRFLKIINRNIDMTTGAGVEDFCILTNGSYVASKKIPFISAREYESGSGQQDIFIKNGTTESLYVKDVYGRFLLTDGDSTIFMRKTNKGFDVIRKTGEEETVTASLSGSMSTTFVYSGDYIFNKNEGKLYNLKTGESKLVVGYRMSPEMISVSPDGKYLVMLGTVTNIMDYQVHIFNLETGEYSKFQDENYSNHSNLTFINNTTAMYMVLDPNQGYEYVVLDMNKVK